MKFIIVLACLLVLAYANEEANVLKSYTDVGVDQFKYGLELDNGIKADQEGHLEGDKTWVVKGGYEYHTKEGKHIAVQYVADEHGYQPTVQL